MHLLKFHRMVMYPSNNKMWRMFTHHWYTFETNHGGSKARKIFLKVTHHVLTMPLTRFTKTVRGRNLIDCDDDGGDAAASDDIDDDDALDSDVTCGGGNGSLVV